MRNGGRGILLYVEVFVKHLLCVVKALAGCSKGGGSY